MSKIKPPEYSPGLFVNRRAEIEFVLERVQMLQQGDPLEKRTIAFMGERGIGKTWLLAHLEHEIKNTRQASVFLLNLDKYAERDPSSAVIEALQALHLFLTDEKDKVLGESPAEISREVMGRVRDSLEKQTLVCLVDHVYESGWELLGAFEDYLLGPVAIEQKTLIVLAGRGRTYPWKTSELRPPPEPMLPFLSPEDTKRQIQKQVVDPKEDDYLVIHSLSGGYPLSNFYFAAMGFSDGVEENVQALLEKVPEDKGDKLRQHLEALSVLKAFDEERINAMLAAYYEKPSYQDQGFAAARQIREEIVKYGFARWMEEERGYVMDRAIQTAVTAALRYGKRKRPELWVRLHGAAVALFETWVQEYEGLEEQLEPQIEYHLRETYRTARATPELVGRSEAYGQIEAAIRDTSKSYIIYICGVGGVGKTRLIQHVLANLPEGLPLLMASDLIDLYHMRTHSLSGFIGACLEVWGEFATFFREELGRAEADLLEAVARAEQEGLSLAEIISRRKDLTDLFLRAINRFAEQKRLVLALDTAERLLLESDPVQQPLRLMEERPAILDWLLKDFLPNINNAVILLAGRPERGDLRRALEKIGDKRFVPIDLRGFSEKEALLYYDAVAIAAEKESDTATAQWLRILPAEQRQVIFNCLCDDEQDHSPEIRPILLALVIDYLSISGRFLPGLTISLAEAREKSPQERRLIREQVEAELVRLLLDTGRPADNVIRNLAWTPKGMDAELLARVTGLMTDGKWDTGQAQMLLNSIRDLSFVKIRPADNRVFLHDEMYDLLRRHVLEHSEQVVRAEHVYQAIRDYYKKRIDRAYDEIAGLYGESTKAVLPDPKAVIAARANLQDALVEDLHYQLLRDPTKGFQTYFRYAEEAVVANDESLDMQLRGELLSVLIDDRQHADDQGDTIRFQEINHLLLAVVEPDAAIRWVKRMVSRERYDDALRIVERLRDDAAHLIKAGGDLIKKDLDSWKGLVHVYEGKFEAASTILSDYFLKHLEVMEVPEIELLRWSAIVARAYNNYGYLARVRGQFILASNAYKKALPYWRYLGMEVEQANTLNNLAFVLGLQGDFDIARRQGRDALQMRKRLGPRGPVVLSLATLAEIEIYAGNYREARGYAEQALDLARLLGFRRGEGLARLSLAALSRFRAEPEQVESSTERKGLLNQSLEHSRKAYRIFTNEIPEPEREIRALYEEGVTLRQFCRRLLLEGLDIDEALSGAETRLQQAAGKARERGLWLPYLDASLGRAWLYYYARKNKQLLDLLQSLEKEIEQELSEYKITKQRLPKREAKTVLGIFGQLARAHVLRGIQALDAYEASSKCLPSNDLEEAARQFTLTFEYDALIARDFWETTRAMNLIHGRLRAFNPREMLNIYEAVTRTPGEVLPEDILVEDLLFWDVLNEHFGPYEVWRRLAN
ncbi:MAG: ATP-binding protein [Chloroflexi bacterium]|nr:ATP-binding protein [Chloroflexota bacterium]